MFLKFYMRQIVSFLSSLDWEAKNLPKGSKVRPLALASKIYTGAKIQCEKIYCYLPCSLTSHIHIVESVEQLAKWRLSGLHATSDIAIKEIESTENILTSTMASASF